MEEIPVEEQMLPEQALWMIGVADFYRPVGWAGTPGTRDPDPSCKDFLYLWGHFLKLMTNAKRNRETGCILFPNALKYKVGQGCGRLDFAGKCSVPDFVFILANGFEKWKSAAGYKDTAGRKVVHLCHELTCVNANHLALVEVGSYRADREGCCWKYKSGCMHQPKCLPFVAAQPPVAIVVVPAGENPPAAGPSQVVSILLPSLDALAEDQQQQEEVIPPVEPAGQETLANDIQADVPAEGETDPLADTIQVDGIQAGNPAVSVEESSVNNIQADDPIPSAANTKADGSGETPPPGKKQRLEESEELNSQSQDNPLDTALTSQDFGDLSPHDSTQ